MEQSDQINELAAALCEAQKNPLFAIRDSNNPFFKSKYADLSSVWDSARKPLTDNGLSVVQTTSPGDDGRINIVTTLIHKSGQWIRGVLPVRPVKDDPQAVGSAITYGRRYGLQAMVGICPDDDDAEGAMSREKAPGKAKKEKPAAEPPKSTVPQTITAAQRGRIFALAKEIHAATGNANYGDGFKEFVKRWFKLESFNDINQTQIDYLISYMEKELSSGKPQ